MSFAELFSEHLPFYLSIGMTPDQYWEGDCTLVIAYREAWKLRQQETNKNLWLQGLYIYEALCCVSPVLHAFAKNGTKPLEYRSEPIALTKEEIKERKERDDRRRYEEIKAWAKRHNARFAKQAEKEANENG